MRIISIIQARMNATRLPGKVLLDICGKTLLEHIIERVKQSRFIDSLVLATTSNPRDRALIELARQIGINSYAGSEDDVLDRFYQAARLFGAEVIVRITADDPFKDPQVIDKIVDYFLKHRLDYASNTIKPTYPEGLDVEVFSFAALEKAWRQASKPSEREHVTPYIWNHPEIFKLANIENAVDLSRLRWTLDYEEDLQFAREIYKRLYRGNVFLMSDILALLKKEPELEKINQGFERDAGYKKSLQNEQARSDV